MLIVSCLLFALAVVLVLPLIITALVKIIAFICESMQEPEDRGLAILIIWAMLGAACLVAGYAAYCYAQPSEVQNTGTDTTINTNPTQRGRILMNDTEQNILKQKHSCFVRGYTMATLDSMYMAACQAAPWRKEDWKTLKHDLEEALTADWRREDQETNKLSRALEHITAHTKTPSSDRCMSDPKDNTSL